MACLFKYFFLSLMLLTGLEREVHGQSLYGITFKDIDGNLKHISDYQGRKVLFIVLPGDTSLLKSSDLIAFADSLESKVKVVGIVSNKDFTVLDKERLKVAYSRSNVTFTEHSGDTASLEKDPLLQWLTKQKQNGHFEESITPGKKFFVSEEGRLFSVTGPGVALNSPLMGRIVNAINRSQL